MARSARNAKKIAGREATIGRGTIKSEKRGISFEEPLRLFVKRGASGSSRLSCVRV